jgi:DNA-binding response OmpR family regulator
MSEKILVIDDEEPTVQLITMLLDRRGFDVIKAFSAEEGLRQAYRHQPDLVLVDIMMPEMDGWEVCKRLREMSDVPIIFLTARGEVRDVVRGLEMGADDYVIKPYDNDELIARVKAHLRRSPRPNMSDELVFDGGAFRINFMNREVYVRNEIKHLTPKEFNLLGVLVRNAGRVVTRTELVTQAWGEEYGDAIDSGKL